MQRAEEYTNKDDWQKGIKEGKAMIFSSSLVDKKVSRWRNKFINLNDDVRLHNESIKKLKEDGLIDQKKTSCGIEMCNASEYVKEYADFIKASNNDDGVAKAFLKILNEKS